MWAMLAAPLIAGNDLRKMSKETQAILTNKEVIAVNQIRWYPGFKDATRENLEIWFKHCKAGLGSVLSEQRKHTQKVAFDWKNESLG